MQRKRAQKKRRRDTKILVESRTQNKFPYIKEVLFNIIDFLPISSALSLVRCNRSMIKLFYHNAANVSYKTTHTQTLELLDELQKFHQEWANSAIDIVSFNRHINLNLICKIETATTKIMSIMPKQLNVNRFLVANMLELKYPITKILAAVLVGDCDMVKDGIRTQWPLDYHVAYTLAVLSNQVAIVKLLVDAFPINLLCCQSFAFSQAVYKRYPEMVKTLISCNANTISEIDRKYDTQEWSDIIRYQIYSLCNGDYKNSDDELACILLNELQLSVGADYFFDLILKFLDYFSSSEDGVKFIFEKYNSIFYNRPQWIATFYDILCVNVERFKLEKIKIITYLLNLECISDLISKHKLLKMALNSHNYNEREFVIQKILQHEKFTWDVVDEILRDEKFARSNYTRLGHGSNSSRKFLCEKNIDPAFDGYYLLQYSLHDFDVDTVKYCLQDKTSPPINYWLATSDVYMQICTGQMLKNTDMFMDRANLIIKMLLDDGRAKPYIKNNIFLETLIEHGFVDLIKVLIDSGKIFFPVCMSRMRISSYHCDSVRLFAENEIYFEQVTHIKKSKFVDEINKVHGDRK